MSKIEVNTIDTQDGTGSLTIKQNDTAAITIDTSQNVGIGTSSPGAKLHIGNDSAGDENTILRIEGGSASGYSQVHFADSGDVNVGRIQYTHSSNTMALYTNDTEAMRIDSSGNVLVGTNSTTGLESGSSSNEGNSISGNGKIAVQRNGDSALYLAKSSGYANKGFARFFHNGSEVGKIGIESDDLFIGTGDVGIRFNDGGNSIFAINTSDGNTLDDHTDLGGASERWKDIYAGNGTIQTSDQNEKQSIESLTASEIAVAKRISKLFKTFKFNSAVEKKGDSARTHTGIIAQDVQQAFADEGLDAGNYGMFISSTWWEKEISVDAVAEELDEGGNIIVEGKDAYTYMDIKDEATEGYTERTRLGIRYPELLSFVSSAFEQRLTNIETRLEALENV